MNYRPDKKLKRKKAYRDWKKTRDTIMNYLREKRNRHLLGLPEKGRSRFFALGRKYHKPLPSIVHKQLDLMRKLEKEVKSSWKLRMKWRLKWVWFMITKNLWKKKTIRQS
jgi:hypothetical protein